MIDAIIDRSNVSDLIAGFALLVAFGSLVWQWLAHRQQQQREREEASTAMIVVTSEDIPDQSTKRLIIRNLGPAKAESVEIGTPVSLQGESPPTFVNIHNIFPVPVLSKTEHVSLIYYVTWGAGHVFRLDVSWTDPRGRHTETKTITAF